METTKGAFMASQRDERLSGATFRCLFITLVRWLYVWRYSLHRVFGPCPGLATTYMKSTSSKPSKYGSTAAEIVCIQTP